MIHRQTAEGRHSTQARARPPQLGQRSSALGGGQQVADTLPEKGTTALRKSCTAVFAELHPGESELETAGRAARANGHAKPRLPRELGRSTRQAHAAHYGEEPTAVAAS